MAGGLVGSRGRRPLRARCAELRDTRLRDAGQDGPGQAAGVGMADGLGGKSGSETPRSWGSRAEGCRAELGPQGATHFPSASHLTHEAADPG